MTKLEALFVDMCDKLRKLQKNRRLRIGDEYAYWEDGEQCRDINIRLNRVIDTGLTFLPTPEQCQELSGENWVEFDEKIYKLVTELYCILIEELKSNPNPRVSRLTARKILAVTVLADVKWGLEWRDKDWRNNE